MKRLWLKYCKLLVISIFLISLTSAVQIAFEFLKGTMLDVALSKDESKLITLIGILFIAATIKAFTHYLYSKNYKILMVRSLADIRMNIINSLFKRSYPEYITNKTGEYLAIYTNQLDTIQWYYYNTIYGLLQIITETLFAVVGLIIIDWRLALAAIILLTPVVLFPLLMKGWIRRVQEKKLQYINEHIGRFTEWIKGMEIINNYGAKERFLELFSNDTRKIEKNGVQFGAVLELSYAISTLLTQLSLVGMIIVTSGFVLYSGLSVGMFFAAVGIMEKLQNQVVHITSYAQQLMGARVAINNVKKIVDYEVKKEVTGKQVESVFNIEFNKVSYSYANIQERMVIKDFSLEVNEKGTYIISGESGSGKSTLMNLLQNYYSICEGRISINDVEVDSIENLTETIAIMRQEAVFFEDTLRNNLTMYQSIADSKIFDLMKQLGLEKYANIESLNDVVFNGGAKFSGGEARRLSLIRCLLKESDILILDEPLANVDPISIEKIVDTISRLSKRYIFIITHQITEKLESSSIAHIHLE